MTNALLDSSVMKLAGSPPSFSRPPRATSLLMALPLINQMQTIIPAAMAQISQNTPSGAHKSASAPPTAAPNTLPLWFGSVCAGLVGEVLWADQSKSVAAIAGARKAQAMPIAAIALTWPRPAPP